MKIEQNKNYLCLTFLHFDKKTICAPDGGVSIKKKI